MSSVTDVPRCSDVKAGHINWGCIIRWFKHIVSAHTDIKIRRLMQEFHADGYAFFFIVLELIGGEGQDGRLSLEKVRPEDLSLVCHITPVERVQKILDASIKIGLFRKEATNLFCPALVNGYSDDWANRKRRKHILDIAQATVEGDKNELRTATETYKEIYKIGDKGKYNLQIEQVVAYLNNKTGKSYRTKSQDNRLIVTARLKEGYTVEDICKVVDNMCDKWLGDEKMEQYLRPQTLFQRSKIEGYLNVDKGLLRRFKEKMGE